MEQPPNQEAQERAVLIAFLRTNGIRESGTINPQEQLKAWKQKLYAEKENSFDKPIAIDLEFVDLLKEVDTSEARAEALSVLLNTQTMVQMMKDQESDSAVAHDLDEMETRIVAEYNALQANIDNRGSEEEKFQAWEEVINYLAAERFKVTLAIYFLDGLRYRANKLGFPDKLELYTKRVKELGGEPADLDTMVEE